MLVSWIVAAVLAGATSQAADGQATSPPAAPTEEKMICRRERVMGSNMPVKICRTKSQIEAEQRAAERLMDQPSGSGRGGGG